MNNLKIAVLAPIASAIDRFLGLQRFDAASPPSPGSCTIVSEHRNISVSYDLARDPSLARRRRLSPGVFEARASSD